jgi:hypothetical protein
MTNKTQALGRRLIGALRNENVVVVVSTSLHSVTLVNAKTGKGFITIYQDRLVQEFGTLIGEIKSMPGYPAPKERKVYGRPSVRHTQTTGVSMGRFIPGNLSAVSEA